MMTRQQRHAWLRLQPTDWLLRSAEWGGECAKRYMHNYVDTEAYNFARAAGSYATEYLRRQQEAALNALDIHAGEQ